MLSRNSIFPRVLVSTSLSDDEACQDDIGANVTFHCKHTTFTTNMQQSASESGPAEWNNHTGVYSLAIKSPGKYCNWKPWLILQMEAMANMQLKTIANNIMLKNSTIARWKVST